jgi:hypothetical protein
MTDEADRIASQASLFSYLPLGESSQLPERLSVGHDPAVLIDLALELDIVI